MWWLDVGEVVVFFRRVRGSHKICLKERWPYSVNFVRHVATFGVLMEYYSAATPQLLRMYPAME